MLWWIETDRLPFHSSVCFVAQFLLNFHVNFVLESSFVSDLCLSKPPDSRFVSHICVSELCCGPSPLLSSCAASLCLVAARRWWCWSWCHHRLPASLAQLHRHFPCFQTAWRTHWRPAVGASRTHPPVYPCGPAPPSTPLQVSHSFLTDAPLLKLRHGGLSMYGCVRGNDAVG